MRASSALPLVLLILAGLSAAAFEPVPQSPWLVAGAASALFPRTPLAFSQNPALIGLMESPAAAISGARSFGLSELDRAAAAGCMPLGSWTPAAFISATGDETYSELSAALGGAWRVTDGVVLGASGALRSLSIEGYGSATGWAASAGLVVSPMQGVYGSVGGANLARSGLGSSGDPAGPRVFELAAGVCPTNRIRLSAGYSRQEGLDPEPTFCATYLPPGPMSLSFGYLGDPGRFCISMAFVLQPLQVLYGFASHPSLDPSHLAAVSWGRCAFEPDPVGQGEEAPGEEPVFPLDVNTATVDQLCLVPGIGPAKAEAIVAWRLDNGPFLSIDELVDVPGIGPAMLPILSGYLEVR
jgi:competence ComEA-like helix-hairpin-helix protein